jgi:hypothetical protein
MKDFVGFVKEATYGQQAPSHDIQQVLVTETPGEKSIFGEKRITATARFNCPCCGRGLTVELGFKMPELPDLGPHGGNVG